MHKLFREMPRYRNGLGEKEPDPLIVADFESRYDKIVDKTQAEYETGPPSGYYRKGYNLFVRLREYKKQAIVLRSQDKLRYICDGLSTVYLLRSRGAKTYG